jgi:hypothetical protein
MHFEMKSLIITTVIFLCAIAGAFAQTSYERASYEKKIRQYSAMQTGGIIMGVTGVASTTAGVALLASMDDDGEDNVGRAVGGVLLVIVGVPLVAGGTTLGIIGSVKRMKYKAKLENLSFNFRYDGQQKGLVVRYRF